MPELSPQNATQYAKALINADDDDEFRTTAMSICQQVQSISDITYIIATANSLDDLNYYYNGDTIKRTGLPLDSLGQPFRPLDI